MKKKTKIIIFSSALGVIILALVAVVIVFKLTKTTNDGDIEIWKEKPFVYENAQKEKTYTSYNEPFAEAVLSLKSELDNKSKSEGKQLKIVSAYTSNEGMPTMIVAYNNQNSKLNFLVCKFNNGKFYKTYIESDIAELSGDNDILLVDNSDVIAVRSGNSGKDGRQVIYNFDNKSYCAVKDNSYETYNIADMNETLKLYDKTALKWNSYNELSVKENITQYLDKFNDFKSDGK